MRTYCKWFRVSDLWISDYRARPSSLSAPPLSVRVSQFPVCIIGDVSQKNQLKLHGHVTSMRCNPCFYYVAVSFKNGLVKLIATDPKAYDLRHITKLLLCSEDITSVMFSCDGKECVLTSFPTGLFYRVSVSRLQLTVNNNCRSNNKNMLSGNRTKSQKVPRSFFYGITLESLKNGWEGEGERMYRCVHKTVRYNYDVMLY